MTETLLIGIGTQKAGTTWLSDYFRTCQPSVHQTLMKEVHFFDNFLMPQYGQYFENQRLQAFKRSVQGLSLQSFDSPEASAMLKTHLDRFRAVKSPEGYLDFMRANAGDAKILCDITPDYALLGPDGFRLMRDMHANVKLIYLLRNPADRFWSSLRFNQTHNPAFDIDANFDVMLARQDFLRFADYERTIQAVLSHFPSESLHMAFYENLFADDAIRQLTDWLGLSFVRGNYGARSNAAIGSGMSEERRRALVRAYHNTYLSISERFNGNVPKTWREDIDKFL